MGATIKKGDAVRLDAHDALRMAVTDKKFAAALVKNPEKFKNVFGLRANEIAAIKNAGLGSKIGPAAEYE